MGRRRDEEVEHRVRHPLDAAVHELDAVLARLRRHKADGLRAALGDVLVLELLRPRQPEALVEVAAALVRVRLEVGRQHDAQPAARNVAEAVVVAVEVASRDEEGAIWQVGEALGDGRQDRREEARVEPQRERPPAIDVDVGTKGVPRGGRHRAEELDGSSLSAPASIAFDAWSSASWKSASPSAGGRRVEAREEVARELRGDLLDVVGVEALADVLAREERSRTERLRSAGPSATASTRLSAPPELRRENDQSPPT